MGLRAVTVILNSNHTKRFAVLLSETDATILHEILRQARNKFRIKALAHVFRLGGTELHSDQCLPFDCTRVWIGKGEDYTGPSSPEGRRTDLPGETKVMADASHVDSEAKKQLEALTLLPGVQRAVGMPDLHPGTRFPIGCAVVADCIYPALVGSDIGCGVALYVVASRRKLTPARLAAKLVGLDTTWDGDSRAWLAKYGLDESMPTDDLGTVGAGNHFAELCDVENVYDETSTTLQPGMLCLLVHSGSRGLGASILGEQTANEANPRLIPGTSECDAYLARHDAAVTWGRANRDLIAHRIRECLFAKDEDEEGVPLELTKVADVTHNAVEPRDGLWYHRKGAAPALGDGALVPCPGSRGTFSYLLRSVGSGDENGEPGYCSCRP